MIQTIITTSSNTNNVKISSYPIVHYRHPSPTHAATQTPQLASSDSSCANDGVSWVFTIISIKYSGARLKLQHLDVKRKELVMDLLGCFHHSWWLLCPGV